MLLFDIVHIIPKLVVLNLDCTLKSFAEFSQCTKAPVPPTVIKWKLISKET